MPKNHDSGRMRHAVAANVIVILLSVVLTLALMAVMILNAPIISYTDSDHFNQISQISITKYFKTRKPMQYIEGKIVPQKTEELDMREDIAIDLNDGLDLKQTIEGQFTILFLGFDSEENGSGTLHDVNYLIQFNLLTASMNILQIPRDTYMPGYTTSSTGKFNSIYAHGDSSKTSIQRVVDCVQESFGIPVDAYVTTTCDNVAGIVDIVGGVPIDMPYPVVFEADKTIPNGEHVLTGEESEWFLRFRYGYQDADIGRVQAQRIFMVAAMKKAISMNTVQMFSAVNKVYDQELIATDLSIEDISRIADLAGTIQMENVNVFMLPGESAWANGQSIWSVHKSAALDILNEYFRTQQIKLTDKKSAIVEYITEENYQSTAYDNSSANFEDIDNGEEGRPQLKNNYKTKYYNVDEDEN
ncbi:MAG: LCP family protein [Oscillospiraceae bacterium]|nr:LCP family protein [Oscillospiraceae bacterium]MDE5885575.1 LCP family protein [Oscillospiraceae bacterium]